MSDTVKGTRTPDPLTTTGNGGLTERLAQVLRGHVHERDQDDPSLWSMYCSCGECVHTCHPDKQWLYRAHLAAALAAVVAELVAEAKVEALREEARWLRNAHENSAVRVYQPEKREGFGWAVGWVERHAEHGQTWIEGAS